MMTLTLVTATARRLSSALRALAAPTFAAVKGARQRRAAAQLLRLDDRMLRDIGLQRSDVFDAMSLPAGLDVGVFLEERQHAHAARYATPLAALSRGALATPANEKRAVRRAA